MKQRSLLLLMLPLLFFSCNEDENPIGKWDDNIKLSTKYVEIGADSDSVLIKTRGEWWWIDAISFQDSLYSYYNRNDVDIESDSYLINEDQFVVERRDAKSLFISLEPNSANNERKLTIYLQAGNYFDYVTLVQSGVKNSKDNIRVVRGIKFVEDYVKFL